MPSAPGRRVFLPPDRAESRLALVVFAVALIVRFYFLYEHSRNPAFFQPTVDSLQYHLAARGLSEGRGLDFAFFWQPFFYPFFLSVVYFFAGPSVICAKIIQVLLGACTGALTYRLGRRVFDRPTGLLAGLAAAFYGPLVFYDAELLGEGWAAFWSVSLMLLLLRTAERRTWRLCLAAGACMALAVITRPTFVPFCAAALAWLVWKVIRAGRESNVANTGPRVAWGSGARELKSTGETPVPQCRAEPHTGETPVPQQGGGPHQRPAPHGIAALLAGVLLVLVPVAVLHQRAVGGVGVLPVSGGVNLYIGNNANPCETLTIRPGEPWSRLLAVPARHGCRTQAEQARYFYGKAWEFAASDPAGFAKGLVRKAAQFVSGREIPRNLDIYGFHEWSRLLRALVWKAGGFGFPWGVVFPLAVAALVVHRRRVPAPMIGFAVLYPLAVILVFVAGRYRVPAAPIFLVLAAAACTSMVEMARSRRRRPLLAMLGLAGGLAVAASLAPPWCEERVNYAAEMYLQLGDDRAMSGEPESAERLYREALRRGSEGASVHDHLAVVLAEQGQYVEAIAHFDAALARETDADARFAILFNRAHARTRAGDTQGALRDYGAALAIRPAAAAAYLRRGVVYRELGDDEAARQDWEEALRLSPSGEVADRARALLDRLRADARSEPSRWTSG